MVVTMTQSNIAYLAIIVITVVELQVYWSGKLNAVHVALVVHSKVTELNTGGNCTSSTKKKKKKKSTLQQDIYLPSTSSWYANHFSANLSCFITMYWEHTYQFYTCG